VFFSYSALIGVLGVVLVLAVQRRQQQEQRPPAPVESG
jgi:hypothetical protein